MSSEKNALFEYRKPKRDPSFVLARSRSEDKREGPLDIYLKPNQKLKNLLFAN